MSPELKHQLDRLTAGWAAVEAQLARGPSLTPADLKLTIMRCGGVMRLCYDGRPIAECSVEEKIAAAAELPALTIALREQRASLVSRAGFAAASLEVWLGSDGAR